ncbi:MAG: AAA domain-containing protein [Cyclobacteriaceae bacterium]|nr:AAA domain-containing protein [Cyclobacteriaceae bacterium]
MTKQAEHIFKVYLRRLTRLAGNNRLLLLLRQTGHQVLDLAQLNHLAVRNAFEIIEALIAQQPIAVCPITDSRVEAVNSVSIRLKRLQRLEKFLFEEKGTRDLHVGWPLLRGKFADGTPVRAPLLFFPVELYTENGSWIIRRRADGEITFNKSLLLAYFHFNQAAVNEELLEISFEEFDSDSTVFRTQLYQLLKEKIEINFNPDTFTATIQKLDEFTRDQFDKQHCTGELKLFQEAVLGIFPQADSQLVPDYLQLIEASAFPGLEDFFASKSTAAHHLRLQDTVAVNLAVKEERVFAPFKQDAWQEHALKSVKLGNSVVVQGPPGTGKSQLIANLIADSMASGKRVLLVCQKRVALDIVYERLHTIGLSAFAGLVHDFRDDRKRIFEKIANQVERVDDYRAQNRTTDVIQTERNFVHLARIIDQLTEELEEYRKALFTDKECGLSAKELYLTTDPTAPRISLRQEYQLFDFQTLHQVVRKIKTFVRHAKVTEADEYLWKSRKSFARYQLSDRDEIERTIKDVKEFLENSSLRLAELLHHPVSFEEAENLLTRKADADELAGLLTDELVFGFFKAMVEEKEETTNLLWFQNMERVCMNCFDGAGVEATLTDDQIGKCQVALQQRLKARRNLVQLIGWELFSEHKFFLKRILIANNLPYNKHGLRTLEERLDNRLNLEHHLTTLKEKKWLLDLPAQYDKRKFKKWFEKQLLAIRARLLFGSLRTLNKALPVQLFSREEFLRRLWDIFDLLKQIAERKSGWLTHLTPHQINALAKQPGLWFNLIQQLRLDFDVLREADLLKESFSSYELEIVYRLYDELKAWDETRFEEVFQNSLRLAWIEHLEAKFPVLRLVATTKLEELEHELARAVVEKQKLSAELVLIRARERTYEPVEYNRLNNRVTYRDLFHQVSKKKKLWPLRRLISEFHHELFNLIPCWMASPEAVSALFPFSEIFDLVIFDEASQCFTERGLPAICRARQVVVAGDSNQLKPFDLYQVRFHQEDEIPDLELESLLDLTSRYLPTVSLQHHYRSQSAELIDFSNRHFYKGKLRNLPSRTKSSPNLRAIEYLNVKGQWKNQTNQQEAEAVITKIIELTHTDPELTIGVVTFNAPQQEVIQDLIEVARLQGNAVPESLFVKNIENVQGDERDVIIFSTAYAPDSSGKLNMHFGSLNALGGENRLNVAITRARQKVIVITSIWPGELKLQDIKNDGPKLLRAYLEFARMVSEGKFIPALQAPKHAASWYLSASILQMGSTANVPIELKPCPWPVGDILVSGSTSNVGLLVCDDEAYEQLITAKEGHVYTPLLMEAKGWPWLRLHSRNWWNNREKLQYEIGRFAYRLSGPAAPQINK